MWLDQVTPLVSAWAVVVDNTEVNMYTSSGVGPLGFPLGVELLSHVTAVPGVLQADLARGLWYTAGPTCLALLDPWPV